MSTIYQSSPLSDKMEERIRERIKHLRTVLDPANLGITATGILALQWVLREAEALKLESAEPGAGIEIPQWRMTGKAHDPARNAK